jgi:hypothetical protein
LTMPNLTLCCIVTGRGRSCLLILQNGVSLDCIEREILYAEVDATDVEVEDPTGGIRSCYQSSVR